jgi:hypothetical protein
MLGISWRTFRLQIDSKNKSSSWFGRRRRRQFLTTSRVTIDRRLPSQHLVQCKYATARELRICGETRESNDSWDIRVIGSSELSDYWRARDFGIPAGKWGFSSDKWPSSFVSCQPFTWITHPSIIGWLGSSIHQFILYLRLNFWKSGCCWCRWTLNKVSSNWKQITEFSNFAQEFVSWRMMWSRKNWDEDFTIQECPTFELHETKS